MLPRLSATALMLTSCRPSIPPAAFSNLQRGKILRTTFQCSGQRKRNSKSREPSNRLLLTFFTLCQVFISIMPAQVTSRCYSRAWTVLLCVSSRLLRLRCMHGNSHLKGLERICSVDAENSKRNGHIHTFAGKHAASQQAPHLQRCPAAGLPASLLQTLLQQGCSYAADHL